MTKLAIVEDQSLLRNLLRDLCEQSFGHEVLISAGCLTDLLSALPGSGVEIILLDLNLPDGNGLETADEIRRLVPGVRIIAVSGETTPYMMHRALEARIHGFVDKDSHPPILSQAIETVSRGEPFFTEFITEASRRQLSASDSFTKVLSNTELALMPLFGQGLRNEDIAQRRNLSAATVQTHRRNIMAKLDLHSSLDLMNYAIKSGFVMVRVG